MYVNTLNPVLLKAGPITIYWYSIPYLIGFLVIYWLLAAERKKKSIQNLTEETVEGLFFWLLSREYMKAHKIDKKLPSLEDFAGEKLIS